MTEHSFDLNRFSLAYGELAVRLAGDRRRHPLLLIHGLPASSRSFRDVAGPLSRECFVIAPDLPGFGASEPIAQPTFARYADLIEELFEQLELKTFDLYLHDFGAAVGAYLATRHPGRVRSLIVQNANVHESGIGPGWAATQAYWANPSPALEAGATAHLTFEGIRDQYIGEIPADLVSRMDEREWLEDWRVVGLPGRLETQRALILDYRSHVARFSEIARYLEHSQPPALMLWGRHDIFFELAETLSFMRSLPRMESHILDGPHLLLETHAAICTRLMLEFLGRVNGWNH